MTVCSTHPEAPAGLAVLPGICDSKEFASVIVDNESALPVTVSEKDLIAIGLEEGDAPLLDECRAVHQKQDEFIRNLDWTGKGKDTARGVLSPKRIGLL